MDDQTYQIIGAALEVHKELGCGFLEPVYQEALELELADRKIPFCAQAEMPVSYKGRKLRATYRADVLCYDSVILELKALGKLGDVETAQVLNYLKAGRHERGLLINFGTRSLQHQRFVWSHEALTKP
jgi:GxxExxY protein